MPKLTLEVFIERDASAGWVVRSPAVGVWSEIPVSGTLLDGAAAGVLTQAGQRILLRLPQDARGVVRDGPAHGRRAIDVEWGQELFRLASVADIAAQDPAASSRIYEPMLVAPTPQVLDRRYAPALNDFATNLWRLGVTRLQG